MNISPLGCAISFTRRAEKENNMAHVMNKQEFNDYTVKVAKMSVWAIWIPLTAALAAYMAEVGSPLFFFLITMVTMGAGNRWFYSGSKEDDMFLPLAAVALTIFIIAWIGISAGERASAKYPAGAEVTNVNSIQH